MAEGLKPIPKKGQSHTGLNTPAYQECEVCHASVGGVYHRGTVDCRSFHGSRHVLLQTKIVDPIKHNGVHLHFYCKNCGQNWVRELTRDAAKLLEAKRLADEVEVKIATAVESLQQQVQSKLERIQAQLQEVANHTPAMKPVTETKTKTKKKGK